MKCVIIYSYYPSWYADYNLRFFCKKELRENPNIDYVLLINGHRYNPIISIPHLTNLHVISRDNIGYDFGAHSAALEYLDSIGNTYDYYFFMNSGVFGPVIEDGEKNHWTSKFIAKINDNVKLVGTRIVCLLEKDCGGIGPKVGGFFFMTDTIGLKLLREKGTIFCNHPCKRDAIIYGEYGISNCILHNGYSMDCMVKKHENIDWRNEANYTIYNDLETFYRDPVNPYEIIFHKWFWTNTNIPVCFDIIQEYERRH